MFPDETEIKDLIKYSLHDPFWYNLYNNSNKKLTIDLNTGCLPLSHKLFHPRLINKDKYNNVQQVNLDNGYNDTFKGEEIMSINDLTQEINFTNIGIDKFVTINANGFIKPLQKWIIEAYYKNIKLINESINYQESINSENSENLINKQIDLDNLFIN